jgi:Ca2+-binding EF-hand superfamily protein
MIGVMVPDREGIMQYAYSVFKVIDSDNSDSIDYQEFSDYVRQSEEL